MSSDTARERWPMVKRALDYVVDLQTPRGEIVWERDAHATAAPRDTPADRLLLHPPCAAQRRPARRPPRRPAAALGTGRADRLANALQNLPDAFCRQEPLLDGLVLPGPRRGAVRGDQGLELLDKEWDTFVVEGPRHPLRLRPAVGDGRGDLRAGPGPSTPWATAGARRAAVRRHAAPAPRGRLVLDGLAVRQPQALPARAVGLHGTAAVVLAADALLGLTPGAALFRDIPSPVRQAGLTPPRPRG
ncbi:hypothetical protein [Nonomuraea dietziae]|uniref:hypothetical protein n=1 Tax=Nonomuraea dietziae TaxID=65515 RepID=UPI0031E1E457